MSWHSYPPAILQICAVALGGKNLSSLCRIFSGDYKQFTSGAPDLHMIRAFLTCRTCGRKLDRREKEEYESFDWKGVLGEKWDQKFNNNEEGVDAFHGIFQEFSEDAILQHDYSDDFQKQKKRMYWKNGQLRFQKSSKKKQT